MRLPNLYQTSALSFNDVLLVPQHSLVPSRQSPNLETKLTRNISISHPVVATNMSTITESDMMYTMWDSGSYGFLHRFMTTEQYQEQLDLFVQKVQLNNVSVPPKCVVSVGVKGEELENGWLDNKYIVAVLIDVAHGDSSSVINTISDIKSGYPSLDVIAGNIATRDGFMRMVDAGADAVRIGIGGGSCCTTRLVTGHGLPTLASIIDCAEVSYSTGVPIIADGGFASSGDIVKALAFGASSVCLGSMLSATSSTPGEVIELKEGKFKEYYGMSSYTAQNRHKSIGKRRGIAAEGIEKLVAYKGDTSELLAEILGGVSSGLTYSGAWDIQELRNNVEYVTLTTGSMKESKLI
jgi:IMP dehydrogenase